MSPSNAIPLSQYVRPLEVPMGYPIAALGSFGHYTPIGIDLPPDDEYLMPPRPLRRRHKNRNHHHYQDQRPQINEEVPRPPIDGMETVREASKSDQFAASGTNNEVLEIEKKKSSDHENPKRNNDENYELFQKLSTAVRDEKPNKMEGIETMPPDPPKKPVGIRKKTLSSPNGQVTYITEMLYDVEDNSNHGNNRVTRPPSQNPASPFIPASTDVLLPPTDDPVRSTHPYPYPISIEESTGVRKASTTESITEWPSLPTPPTHYQTQQSSSGLRDRSGNMKTDRVVQAAGSDRRESNLFNSEELPARTTSSFNTQSMSNVHKHQTTRAMPGLRSSSATARMYEGSMTRDKTWKEAKEGLGAAAIAGIVIGSLVSITLLAGTHASLLR
jgi:hypothetical protein